MSSLTRNKITIAFAILGIVILALHFFALNRGDTVNDEVFMSFRAVGLIDFDLAEFQTTPYEWFDPVIPWWTHLSFHDHPKLVPIVEHVSMTLFGETNFGFRLPSAILGLTSIWLLYLVGRRLYGKRPAAIAAILYAVTLNHVYISRVGMQEAYVIFFLLLGTHVFLKSLGKPKYLYVTGAAIGLGLLTKYTLIVCIPIFLVYLLMQKRDYFRRKELYGGALLALLIASPILVYNLMLYRTVGHFDFQLSHIFGQNPDVWKVAPGKEIGNLGERVSRFIPGFIKSYSWLFLGLAAASLIGFTVSAAKKPNMTLARHLFLVLSLIFLTILILFIGPGYRFLAMFSPYVALIAGLGISKCFEGDRTKKFLIPVLSLILTFEIFYSWNNQIAHYPLGPKPWASSYIRLDTYNWGYNELGKYLEHELSGKQPALSFDVKYKFLEDLRDQALAQAERQNLEPYPAIIVYAGNFDDAAELWVLDRLNIYHAWPIISEKTYLEMRRSVSADYFKSVGFKDFYLIESANYVPRPEIKELARGESTIIKNPRGDIAFQIYHFTL